MEAEGFLWLPNWKWVEVWYSAPMKGSGVVRVYSTGEDETNNRVACI